MLPPPTDCLLQHLKQSNYKAISCGVMPLKLYMQNLKSTEGHGWTKNGELLVPQPITKALAPVNLLSDSEESCEESISEEELLNS